MTPSARRPPTEGDQDERIAVVVERERLRLQRFIRRRVRDSRDAEDVLQDVLSKLVEANRLLMPIEHVTGWLFRVARNRIIDLLRRPPSEPFANDPGGDENGECLRLEEMLPSRDAGPEREYLRKLLLDELEAAVAELPPEQREVFIAHEIHGVAFNTIAARSGIGLNTLLSRKRYAVQHLRRRLRRVYEDLTR